MNGKTRSGLGRLFGFVGGLVGVTLLGALAVIITMLFTSYSAPSTSQPQGAGLQPRIATPIPIQREPTMLDLYKQKGDLLAEGTNTNPIGNHRLTTYRVEALTLAKPMNITRDQRIEQVSRAWRITIRGGPFHVGALGYVIWIDDTSLGFAQENRDLSEISTLIFDRSLLRDGATIAVSYGENRDERIVLPELLKLSRAP